MNTQHLIRLAELATDVAATVDESEVVTAVTMGEMADGSARSFALVDAYDSTNELEQQYRISSPAPADAPEWAREFDRWTIEIRSNASTRGWLELDIDELEAAGGSGAAVEMAVAIEAIEAADARPAIGARVRLAHDLDRFPHFLAPAGSLGTVVDIGDPGVYAVRLDETLPGAEEWDNAIIWSVRDGDEPTSALELVAGDDDEQDRSYEIASADVVLPLTREDAEAIADALETFASVDDGENTDYDELMRLVAVVRAALEVRS
jgi:hypothetical protein